MYRTSSYGGGGGVNTKSTCYQIKACRLHDNETTQKTDVFSEKHNRLKETGLGGGGEGGGVIIGSTRMFKCCSPERNVLD